MTYYCPPFDIFFLGGGRVPLSPAVFTPLCVLTEPAYISDDSEANVSAVQNERITLPCPAHGSPAPRVSWYKDGHLLSGSNVDVQLLPDGSLRLDQVGVSDAGLYTCHAQNIAGNSSKDFHLRVLCKS